MNEQLSPASSAKLREHRARIDEIDRMIVRLVAERQRWVHQSAQILKTMPHNDMAERMEHVLSNVRAVAMETHADPDVVEKLYRAMIAAFADRERG